MHLKRRWKAESTDPGETVFQRLLAMLSVANYLKKPRRGEPPPSDVGPGSATETGSGIVQCLRVKGFCVINHAVSEKMVAGASAELEAQEWYQPAVLIQEGLLGVEGSNRIAKMASIDFPESSSEQFQDGLAGIDFAMWKLAEAIGPFQDEIGFRCCGRSVGFLHQASDPDLEEAELTDQEASDWSAIFTSRKILIMVCLGPGKGTLEMQPYDDEANVSEITTVPGLVVVLRTDQLSFKFFCRGREATHVATSFMLQNDILRMHRNKLEAHLTPPAQELDQWIDQRLREIKEMEPEEAEDWTAKGDVPRNFIHAANRTWFKRQTTVCKGAAARLPVTWEPEVFFLGLTAGADTVIEVPIMRWEHDTVYDPSPDAWKKDPPMTNCRHASFVDGVDLFDNKLFGLSLAETKGMDPGQRLVLEVTYDALYRSGMRKNTLINSTCGMYVGTSMSEWNSAEKAADVGIFGATGGAPSITAGRLSFCLGCKGASLAIDTEAASGLSACFWAAEAVEKKGAGHIQELSCGIGVHLCLAKAWWPAHTAAGFLCPGGRSFTFDASAQGHVRSEGVGTVVLRCQEKMDGQEEKDDLSVGTIVGGATQNSGKSAGMTAPSGPAEQAVLVEACRKSGITTLDVDVVECHGSGRFIADAIEAASCGRALRDGADSNEEEMSQLRVLRWHALAMHGLRAFARHAARAGLAGSLTVQAQQRRREPTHCCSLPRAFSRQQLGWAGQRSRRSRACAGDRELVRIATLINKLVDMDGWDEDQEQELFELSVSACLEVICKGLAPPHYDMLHTPRGLLGEKSVALLTANLVQQCQRECTFPYMDEQDKMRTIRAVVWVIVGSLQPGRTIRSYTKELCRDEESTQSVVVEVFIEGAMDVFFDSEMRHALIQDLKSHIPDLPLVPFLFENIAEFLMKTFSDTLHETLKDAYFVFVDARKNREDLPVLPAVLSGDLQMQESLLMQYCGRPFMLQLRRLLIDRLLEDNSNSLPMFISKLSLRTQALVLGRFVDLLFRALPGLAKIEDTVQPFHRFMHDSSRGLHLPTPAHPAPVHVDMVPLDDISTAWHKQLRESLGRWRDAFARTRRPEEFCPLLNRERLLVGSGLARGQSFESADESPGSSSTPRSSAAYFERYEAELEELRQEDLPFKTFQTSPNNLERSPSKNSMLQLCSMKTNIGNCIETSGIASLIKTFHSIRWGIVCANNHLNQLNPHLDISSCPLLMCTEPTEQKLSAVFVGVSSWGFGGTNVHMHCYGGVDEEIRLPPEPTPQELRPRLSYWPSGGGDLGSMSRPRRGFFIIGSWSGWTEPEPMEDEGDGCYGYTLVLGDTRWEQFQLLIDNSYSKVLHPQRYKAPKGTEVFGPTRQEEVMQDSTWFVDGRPNNTQIRAITASAGATAVATPEPLTFTNEDEGLPGQLYRIRLHIAGKWRTVTWAKAKEAPQGLLALKGPEAKYYVAGSWNNYRFEEMTAVSDGTYTCEVSLSSGPNRFQITRNGDWHQAIFPVSPNAGPTVEIEGPSDRKDRHWLVSATAGEKLKITFQRTIDASGSSKMKVLWEKL
ncbi:Phthiocerol synthesis polyketide synthase type I PpsD [Symbiodinium microadriaticum]|uniref:Phthiocerol synthesis polyketide synthase type I PpsD n=1 Tax=Symbiodinium microadriaticum TaxID=2951 RepID=A0A1Q9CHW8_SYMMI|nr:Phthiocerol synthesis polyketide synthase type I PpsD [Symbiodinium microadriaticum]